MTYPYLKEKLSLVWDKSSLSEAINDALDVLMSLGIIIEESGYFSPTKKGGEKELFDSISNLMDESLKN